MREVWARPAAVLLGVLLLLGAATEPATLLAVVVAGVIGAGLLAVVVRCVLQVRPAPSAGPTVHAHLRALARRGVPRLRDPDAAGRPRSRAPSGLLPAV